MISAASKLHRFLKTVLPICLLTLFSPSRVLAQENEPIAYIGHGGFFNSKGNQIPVTFEFVATAQAWYRTKLLSGLSADKKVEFADFERRLNAGMNFKGQTRLVVENHSLQWLVANSIQLKDSDRTLGKIRALRYALNWKLPERVAGLDPPAIREEFKLDPALENKLKQFGFNPDGGSVSTATINSGQDYINECTAAGVPIPPPIGQMDPAGLAGWKSQGFIPTAEQFINQIPDPSPAEVRTFEILAPSPQEGMCIALPRYTDATLATVELDGVICLSKLTSKVCFWDNQRNGAGFSFPSGTVIPIGVPSSTGGLYQAGGFELLGGSGGVCTDCHAGQNPYIIHPKADLGGGLLMEELNQPPLNLPTFSASRYDPLVGSTVAEPWPQNTLSHSPTLVPSECSLCHFSGGSGGAFPHLSSEIPGYCDILKKAFAGSVFPVIPATMPPGAPGSEAGTQAVKDFHDIWCNSPASSGPSNRGDPHLTAADGLHYDFQSAGEFVALRGDGLQIQTRQTPVSTTTRGTDPYSGLTVCVSLNTAVAAQVGTHRVTFQPNISGVPDPSGLQLRVDGVLTTLAPNGLDLGSGGRVKPSVGGGIKIDFPDGTVLYATPGWWESQSLWYMNVDVFHTPSREGIMGSRFTPDSWLPGLPDGSSLGPMPATLIQRYFDLYETFADAWRVTDETSLFDYAPGTSTATFTDGSWPHNPFKSVSCVIPGRKPAQPLPVAEAQKICSAVVGAQSNADCVFDVTVTGNPGFANTYLLSQQIEGGDGPATIPTMSEWGLVVLALLLLVAATVYFRRRAELEN